MTRRFGAGLLLSFAIALSLPGAFAHAASLSISPLRYDAALAAGEVKKGFVDITNPTAAGVTVSLKALAFRQVDDQGALEFYDDEAITNGLRLDYSEVDIGPRQTLHLAFLLDGTKLPAGDVFAALFATLKTGESGAAQQALRVGTLFVISNGTPVNHSADIERLTVPWLQTGDRFSAQFAVKNTSNQGALSGFSPQIQVSAWPYIYDVVTGPLVFSGRARQTEYIRPGSFFGIVRVSVKTGASVQVAYSLLITGYWRWLAPLIGLAAVVGLVVGQRSFRHAHPKN